MKAGGGRAWARSTEQASLAQQGHDIVAARRQFRQLDAATQFALAREIALCRAAELTLAYRNLVMVAAGYKYKRRSDGGERRLPQPCVVLVVKAKWSATEDQRHRDDQQRLPTELLAFATRADGRRVLCAVPTDVRLDAHYSGAQAQTDRAVAVAGEAGTLTCAVELRQGSKRTRYLMSAQHVLSPQPVLDPAALATGQALLCVAGQQAVPPVLGRSANIGGRLRRAPALSLDVQLAEPEAPAKARLRQMLSDLALSAQLPHVAQVDDFGALMDGDLEVLVPDNNPNAAGASRTAVLGRFDGFMPPAFSIEYGDPPLRIHHFELLRLKLRAGRTLPGDSGSPVVHWNDDGRATLVGMHIAGAPGLSYVLPAWQLFDLDAYWQAPAGASLRPVSLG
ncbi:MAG: hypothetical protein ACK44A_14405 [Roseateles sp.]